MLIVRMKAECLTPLHVGCGKDDLLLDQPVMRDSFGFWTIAGTAIAGTMRGISGRINPEVTEALYGHITKDGSSASLFWCSEGRLLDYDDRPVVEKMLAGKQVELPQGPFVRDHVRLGLESGTAVNAGKFDEEIVPAGTRFAFEFSFDPWERAGTDAERELFLQTCAQAAAGRLRLGGKNASGYGELKVLECECREFDLERPAGLEAWLNLSHDAGFANDGGARVRLPAASAAATGKGLSGTLEIPFAADGPIMIGGGSSLDSEADAVFALTPVLDYASRQVRQRHVIPGSAFRGVVRHGVYGILASCGASPEKAEAIISDLFGRADAGDARPGRISVLDAVLTGAAERTVPHVAIDRLSGGALDGALFSEAPSWKQGSGLRVVIRVEELTDAEAAMLFHAILDIAEGSVPVGGGTGRGNGRLRLPGWPGDPGKALRSMRGDLSWNGSPLFPMHPETFTELAASWDAGFKKAVLA